jgi:hypothetical protein
MPAAALATGTVAYNPTMARTGRFAAIAGGLVVLCIAGLLGYRARTAASGGWNKFSAPDGSFTILAPGEPELDDHEAVSESGKPATTLHFVTVHGPTSTFFCNYWDLSYTPADETDAQMAMAGSRDGLIQIFGGKLLSSQASTSDGRYAQSFKSTTTDDGIMERRFFIIGRRLYMLAVARPVEDDDQDTQKFFGSFKLSSANP